MWPGKVHKKIGRGGGAGGLPRALPRDPALRRRQPRDVEAVARQYAFQGGGRRDARQDGRRRRRVGRGGRGRRGG